MNDHPLNEPNKEQLMIRVCAMPHTANHYGDVFGGWMIGQMDLAGYHAALKRVETRLTCVAIRSASFTAPARVGEFISCYGKVLKIGNSSIDIEVTAYAGGLDNVEERQVATAIFVYVSLDEKGRPKKISH